MSLSYTLAALISVMVLAAPPPLCPDGRTATPVTRSDGTVQMSCTRVGATEDTTAARDEAARYAELERLSPEAAEFRGGHGVIYISGGVAILAIILLILLI